MNLEQLLLLTSGTDADLVAAVFAIKDHPDLLDGCDDVTLERLYTTFSTRLKIITIADKDEKLILRRVEIFVLVIIVNKHSARNPYNPEIVEALDRIVPRITTAQ